MILSFSVKYLIPLAEHARASKRHKRTYPQTLTEDESGPGLWLVKDSGAYFMSNGLPGLGSVVYARGCRPDVAPLGGDDWVEFFPLDRLRLDLDEVDITVSKSSLDIEWFKCG